MIGLLGIVTGLEGVREDGFKKVCDNFFASEAVTMYDF